MNQAASNSQNTSRKEMGIAMSFGAFLGLTWGTSLRAWMVVLALEFGDRPQFSWNGTFLAVLLPSAVMGALLGGAAYAHHKNGDERWRWAVLSPLLLVLLPAVAVEDFLSTLISTGLGGGAVAVVLIGMCGAYAGSGRGPRWLRAASGMLALVTVGGMVYGVYLSDRRTSGFLTAREAFGILFFLILMVVFIAGAWIPYRYRANQEY